jgi:tRNA A37 threonylcarbamoyladenosine modification protein TsaB
MEISAAVDFSTANAALAICKTDSDDVIFTVTRTMSGREASSLLPWIIEQLKEYGYTLDNIKQWTCGSGPGSFTGLRIIASLVAGLTYEKENIKVRSIPSGTAIADTISGQEEKTAVLYDGRRNELICFSKKNEPIITISTNNIDQLNAFDKICAMQSEKQALEKILSRSLLEKVKFLSEFPIEKLLLNKTYPWQKNVSGESFFKSDLVYIRPAV